MNPEMKKLVAKAKSDPQFLNNLLDDPKEAIKDFDLDDKTVEALLTNSAGRLGTLVDAGVLAAGCGSSGTCTDTCTVTCTVTFTSIATPESLAASKVR